MDYFLNPTNLVQNNIQNKLISRLRVSITIIILFNFIELLYAEFPQIKNLDNMLNQIRKDKFDYVLPQVMRQNNVDMWVHIIRARKPDALAKDLGGTSGVFIFSDRGGNRIERAVLGFSSESIYETGAYDIISGSEEFEGDAGWEKIIYDFIAERNPKIIALNFSKTNPIADGISYTDYTKLINVLGPRYAERIISAENVIAEFVSGRVMGEIVLDGYFGLITAEKIDREFDKIQIGITTLRDIKGNVFVRNEDGKEFHKEDPDPYLLQKGDLITILNGEGEGIFVADLGGNGYVLKEGETGLPPRINKIWKQGMDVREILRTNIKVGLTAGETLEILINKLQDEGFIYIDKDHYDNSLDPTKTQVHIDLHAQGRRSMDAPRISPLGPDWERNMVIPVFHAFTFEYMIHMPVPEWGEGKHLYIAFHDGAVVTERGVEFPYPPDQGIRILR